MKIDHINITTNNFNKMISFYQDLFGLEKMEESTYKGQPHAIIGDVDKFFLCLYQAEHETRDVGRINHLGIHVSDFDQFLTKVQKAGIELLYGGLIDYPHSKSFYIADPDGNELEISSSFGGR